MTNNRYSNFADLAASGRFSENAISTFDGAFIEHTDLAKMNVIDAPMAIEMPDPDQARAAVEMILATVFDVFRDTRMEEFGQQIAWGITNSFHMTARMVERREDDAAKKLGELARTFDPSEIYATELEESQILCQTLQGCREAMEAMRDFASRCYHVETGRPWQATRGSQVSTAGVTASQIEARDFLAARGRQRREQYNPTGPVVIVSGSQEWTDIDMIWKRLDQIKARIPEMVIASTGMNRGVDKIAAGWAERNKVAVVKFMPNNAKWGNRAAFIRNDTMLDLNPVEALIADGTGIQKNLSQKLHERKIPTTNFFLKDQRNPTNARKAA